MQGIGHRRVGLIDAEHALDPEYAKKLGVDTDALLVSQPDTGEQALEIADIGYVLVQGTNRYTGTGAELMADPEVRRTFLGG